MIQPSSSRLLRRRLFPGAGVLHLGDRRPDVLLGRPRIRLLGPPPHSEYRRDGHRGGNRDDRKDYPEVNRERRPSWKGTGTLEKAPST